MTGKLLKKVCLRLKLSLTEAQESSAVPIVPVWAASSFIRLTHSIVGVFPCSREVDSGLHLVQMLSSGWQRVTNPELRYKSVEMTDVQ